jgi:hypothetical protein
MDASHSLDVFVQKWQQQWPELKVLDVFVSKQQLTLCHAWQCLFFELHDCAFSLEHDTVREQKSLWWVNELHSMSAKSARHPICQVLQNFSADFAQIAEPFLAIANQTPIRSSNTNQLFEQIMPFSKAIANVEHQLFEGQPTHSIDAISVQLLLMRLPHGLQAFDRAAIPMQLLARHQALHSDQTPPALLNDWLDELAEPLKSAVSSNWYRSAQTAFCRRRIKQLRKNGRVRIQLGHAMDAWHAMRDSAKRMI